MNDLNNKFTNLKSDLRSCSHHIIISQIFGINLGIYIHNKGEDDGYWYYEQNAVNEALPL